MLSRTSTLLLPIALTLTPTLAGCAHEDGTYRPVPTPADQAAPEPPWASSYGIPADAPKGTVNVMSLGTERMNAAPGQPDTYLHLRVALENTQDAVPWTASAAEQMLANAGPGGTSAAPAFAQSSSNGPVLTVAPHGHGLLDLFYALPGGAPPATISLAWNVHRGDASVAQITRFERAVQNGPNTAIAYQPSVGTGFYLGVGPGWWYDDWGWFGGPYSWYRPRYYLAPAPLYLHARGPFHASGHMGWRGGRR